MDTGLKVEQDLDSLIAEWEQTRPRKTTKLWVPIGITALATAFLVFILIVRLSPIAPSMLSQPVAPQTETSPLSQFASTTSSQAIVFPEDASGMVIAGNVIVDSKHERISDEIGTGTGALVFSTSPTIATTQIVIGEGRPHGPSTIVLRDSGTE